MDEACCFKLRAKWKGKEGFYAISCSLSIPNGLLTGRDASGEEQNMRRRCLSRTVYQLGKLHVRNEKLSAV